MLHLCQSLALDLEPGQRERAGNLLPDQLERNIPMHWCCLLGQVNLTHATFAERPADPIDAKPRTRSKQRRSGVVLRRSVHFGRGRRRGVFVLTHPLPLSSDGFNPLSPGAEVGRRARRWGLRRGYQTPVFDIDAQGSLGASASPFCSNSIEIRSGERTKAM
jgi:hypothetical protein